MSKWYSFKELKRARTPMPLDSVTGLPDNHVITVVERVISVDDPELIQNNVRTDTFTLNLDAEYDDLNVVVIFTKPNNINVKVAYNGTPTHIPGSAMELVGSLACSVVGIDADGEVRAVTKAAPDTFQVVKSGAYDGSATSDDAELLGQILQAVSDAETAIAEAETATTAATNATSQATSAATSANQAASSANSAASSANSAAAKANSAAVDAQNAYDTLKPYMATIDSCANILHSEVGPDSVVTADDSFPCKPVEMVVYGNTVQNLWVNPSGTQNGVTVTANADSSLTLSGTSTGGLTVYVQMYVLKPNTKYTVSVDKAITGSIDTDISFFVGNGSLNYHFGYKGTTTVTFTTGEPDEDGAFVCGFCMASSETGTTVSGTYRVMLNEGSTAEPWCPPGLNSVGDDGSVDIVTAGKNLCKTSSASSGDSTRGLSATVNDDGTYHISGTTTGNYASPVERVYVKLTPGTYTLSGNLASNNAKGYIYAQIRLDNGYRTTENTSGKITFNIERADAYEISITAPVKGASFDGTLRVQLELGSTATAYEPPNITTTPIDLQGHTLNALPDGTRDELHIDGGGNVVLEKRTQTVQLDGDGNWLRNEAPFVHYTSRWSNFNGLPSGYVSEKHYVDKLPASSKVSNGLYSAGINGGSAYVREPTFASDAAGVKTWMGANTPTVILPLLEPQTIDLGTITPPTMAAPNVTAYVADDTPAEMELDYVRDINIVVDRLEKKVADLVVTEATIV